ncbi:unnamed protein product [Adineta steineri]|uniref:Uncharacterized protein n=1 Tax=Adineta steineri TaxID=433720 RepID=A0A814IBI3_9BILA|nr:unnamed protein product [Adineta steineri]
MIYMLDDNGQPMHSMIALYWKAGETMRETENDIKKHLDDHRSSVSAESFQTKYSLSNISLTKVIMINKYDTIVFARYNTYIMLPCFTISHLLNGLNEEKIKNIANKIGFKPIIIDCVSQPILYSELLKLKSTSTISNQISLYSIDCVRKIFHIYQYTQKDIYNLLDRARLAEASDDISFWEKSYEIGNNLTDYEFLFIDLGLITLLVLLFSRTSSYAYLDPKPPRTKLISWRPLASLVGHLGICFAFQAFIFEYVKRQPWYEPFEFNTEKVYISHINTVVFLQSMFQYIWESIVFSRGAPYRRSIFSNSIYTYTEYPLAYSVSLRIIPDIKFKLIILALALLNFVLMFMFEEYIIENDYISFKRAPLSSTSRNERAQTGTHHLHIENILRLTPDWPPILATPSEEHKQQSPEHVLVNENNQITTNE